MPYHLEFFKSSQSSQKISQETISLSHGTFQHLRKNHEYYYEPYGVYTGGTTTELYIENNKK